MEITSPKIRHVWSTAFQNIILEGLFAAPLTETYANLDYPYVTGINIYKRLPVIIQQSLGNNDEPFTIIQLSLSALRRRYENTDRCTNPAGWGGIAGRTWSLGGMEQIIKFNTFKHKEAWTGQQIRVGWRTEVVSKRNVSSIRFWSGWFTWRWYLVIEYWFSRREEIYNSYAKARRGFWMGHSRWRQRYLHNSSPY